ncbi:MAG TPA: Hsp20/alpha crystallin family protein [Verrucomicrobiota bacterium]|nr:Hsp20/alpha crystallin family protein [Verrucomicrobiota bacterium]
MSAVIQQHEAPAAEAERIEYQTPDVNIYETAEGYTLEADLPGVGKDGVEISLDQNTLTLIGRRKAHRVVEGGQYRESSDADFRRVFELDPVIDTARIAARVEDGVLTLDLPKAEQARPRQIAVK